MRFLFLFVFSFGVEAHGVIKNEKCGYGNHELHEAESMIGTTQFQ
jgi:hypothetical protein